MNKTTIIILVSLVIALIILFVVLLIIKSTKKKRLLSSVESLTKEKNLIISTTLLNELAKASKLANNKKLKSDVESWNKTLDNIQNKDLDNLTNRIVELENCVFEKNYKVAKEKLVETEKELLHVKAKSIKLLDTIKVLTESEERNREVVTKLKSMYREVVFKYNKNEEEYKEVSHPIELQFESIDKLFSAFEVSISNNEYDEIGKIVKVLDDLIHNIGLVIEEAPTIILISTIMLPKKMNDIKTISNKLIREGYNIEYLNLDYNIEETNKKINEIMDKLNVLNIEDSIFELKTLLDYYEGLYSDFDKEKRGKKNYERGIINVNDRIKKISAIMKNLYSEINDLKDTYDLSNEEILVIDEINKDFIEVKDSFKLINDRTLGKIMPYSKLSNECELVAVNLSKVEDNLESTLKNLGSLKEDEARARDQLSEIKQVLNDSKYKIKDYDLPIIPKKFYVELKEAYDAVKEISKELEKKPISIKTLNLRVDTARDLALKLYQTASTTSKTAAMAEMTIVYGNRYRSSNAEVESGLISSTKAFNKGDYKTSLEIIIKALNIVEPGIQKKLLKGLES